MRRVWFTAPVLVAVVLLIALVSPTATAQSDVPFYWESIDVIIDVRENGDMRVTETHIYAFTGPHNRERFRYIPLDKVDGIDQVRVSQDGSRLTSNTGVENNQLWIRWTHRPLRPPETMTFVLQYRVVGGLHLDDDGDQVYWKALFGERDAPILNGSVTVQLPESISGQIDAYESFGGAASSRRLGPDTVEFTLDSPLPPGQELEVRVTFPHGLLNVATPQRREGNSIAAWLFGGLSLLFVLLLFFFRRRWRRAWPSPRYPKLTGPVTTPPSDLPAAVVSVLETRRVTDRTLLTIVVEMCQKGALQMASSRDRGRFRYLLSRRGDPRFEWERLVLDLVPGQALTVDELKVKMAGLKGSFEEQIDNCLVEEGLFDGRPLEAIRENERGWLSGGFWLLAPAIAGLGFGLWLHLLWQLPAVIISIIAGGGFALLYWYMSHPSWIGMLAPTEKGVDEIGRWRGLKQSLLNPPPAVREPVGEAADDIHWTAVTPSRPVRPPPKLPQAADESLWPYVIALDITNVWVGRYALAPNWFAAESPADGQSWYYRNNAFQSFVIAGAWGTVISSGGGAGGGGGGGAGGGGGGGGGG